MTVTATQIHEAMITLLLSKVDPNPEGQEYLFTDSDFDLRTHIATISGGADPDEETSTRFQDGAVGIRFQLLEVFCADHLPGLTFADYREILDLVPCRLIECDRPEDHPDLKIHIEMAISCQSLADLINRKGLTYVPSTEILRATG